MYVTTLPEKHVAFAMAAIYDRSSTGGRYELLLNVLRAAALLGAPADLVVERLADLRAALNDSCLGTSPQGLELVGWLDRVATPVVGLNLEEARIAFGGIANYVTDRGRPEFVTLEAKLRSVLKAHEATDA